MKRSHRISLRKIGIYAGIAIAFFVAGPITARTFHRSFSGGRHERKRVGSQAVKQAIRRGANFLLRHEHKGRWSYAGVPWNPASEGGKTALILESLLQVSQSVHLPSLYIFSPAMQSAIKQVAALRVNATYVASFQANAMNLLPAKKAYRQALFWDAQYLLHSMNRSGGYTYRGSAAAAGWGNGGGWDNSNTQYGVLGMWACAAGGLEIPNRYWVKARSHWVRTQFPDGTWDYSSGPGQNFESTSRDAQTMTPAGIASLLIAQSYLHRNAALTSPRQVHVIRGLHWLNRHFNPNTQNLYALYGDERVALAAGLQTIAGMNWYKAVAANLLARQLPDGSWKSNFVGSDAQISTAYALLILARGLNPILISKLQYSANYSGQWNARPFDAANYTAWVTREFESPMNWQVVPLQSPVRGWLGSPILLISGSHDPHFTKLDLQKFRAFTQAGGLIFVSSDGNSQSFFHAMISYANQTSRHRYAARPLSVKSLIYNLQPWYRPKRPLNLWGLSNGVRYEWIISPVDFGGAWQRQSVATHAYWQIPTNIYLYATGKEPLANRLQSLAIGPPRTPARRTITMALIKYAGNWNPEPAAWPRLKATAARDYSTVLHLPVATPGELSVTKTPIAHLTGTGNLTFSALDIASLRKYLRAGGLLIVDAAGGSRSFTNSFVRLSKAIYPSHPLQRLDSNSGLFGGAYPGGTSIRHVAYRKFVQATIGNMKSPHLIGVRWHGQWRIIFSRFDMTSGLLGTNTWGISGYSPASAQAIMRDLLLYSANGQKVSAVAIDVPAPKANPPVAPRPVAAPRTVAQRPPASPAPAAVASKYPEFTMRPLPKPKSKAIPLPLANIEAQIKGLKP